MECYNNGVLLKEDLDGVDFKWGDGDAIVALMDKLCKNEGVGKILALGSRAAAEKFGKGKEYIVASQGIEPGQHDGKLSAGYARAFAFDPTPGRHTKGNLPTPTIDPAYSDRLTGFRDMRITSDTELVNASGGCLFAMMFGYPPGSLAGLITASTGFKYTPAEVNALGTRSFAMRTAFNLREGINRKNCVMSKRMYDGTGIGGPLDGMKVDVERWGDNFYNALGYDLDGVPLKESLEMIGGLDNVIKDLYPA
jgi:aldehyde:ferredoxin oxidoreductase